MPKCVKQSGKKNKLLDLLLLCDILSQSALFIYTLFSYLLYLLLMCLITWLQLHGRFFNCIEVLLIYLI